MNARFNNHVVSAVCHLDEGGRADGKGGLPHLHLDILMITEDNRLSAKTLITRDFITSMHRIMPIILKKHGFNIDEYEETEEKKQGGLSAKEYNELADRYNKLIDDKAELERKNREKAYEVICQQEHSR